MADAKTKATDLEAPEFHLPSRSLLKAYCLLIPGIITGIHRFYVGKWRSGSLFFVGNMIMLFMAGVFIENDLVAYSILSVWLLIFLLDGWFLRQWVTDFNQSSIDDYELHPQRYTIEDSERIAPWARGRAKKVKLGFFASKIRIMRNYFFFLILPGINGWAASEYESVELLMIPIVILIIIGLIGSLDKTLSRYPTIQEIPGVGQALGRVEEMRKLYWEKEPNVIGAFWGLFRRAGKEYKPYWGIASIVFATVVINGLMSYEENSEYIDTFVAAKIVLFTALFAGIVILINLVPITALSFHYSLSGKTTRLGFMTLLAIMSTVLMYTTANLRSHEHGGTGSVPTYLSGARLEERMKDTEFQEELKKRITFFFSYYVEQNTPEQEQSAVLSDLLSNLAPNDESSAFGVIVEEKWTAILYHHSKGQCYTIKDTPANFARRIFNAENLDNEQKALNQYVKGDETTPDIYEYISEPFSILAIAPRFTSQEKSANILELINKHYDEPLLIAKGINRKKVYYTWANAVAPELSKDIPEGCRELMNELPD